MDYSAPVSFVAGGIQQAGKKKDPADEAAEQKSDEDGIEIQFLRNIFFLNLIFFLFR